MEKEVKKDFNDYARSTTYNERHKTWGYHAPCTDIDAIETDGGLSGNNAFHEYSNHAGVQRTYAVMEIKAAPNESIHATYARRQLVSLVNTTREHIPVFGVEWRIDPFDAAWYFAVHAANNAAKTALGGDAFCMNERAYIEFLYRLRDRDAPVDTRAHMETLPDEKTPRCWFESKNGVRQPPHFTGW